MSAEQPNPYTGSKLITLDHEKVTKDQLEEILGQNFTIAELKDGERLVYKTKRKAKELPNALATQLLGYAGRGIKAFGPAVLLIKAAAAAKLS